MDNEKVYYVHYRTEDAGSVTFALRPCEQDADDKNGHVQLHEMGVSFCSPRDQFSRSRARLIAQGRAGMLEPEIDTATPIREALYETCEWAVRHMAEELKLYGDKSRVPRWFPAFVKAWKQERPKKRPAKRRTTKKGA